MLLFLFPMLIFLTVLILFKKNKLSPDFAGFLIFFITIFLLLANSDNVIYIIASALSINYAPLAVIVVSIAFLVCLCICLSVMINDTRKRQIELLRMFANSSLKKKHNE